MNYHYLDNWDFPIPPKSHELEKGSREQIRYVQDRSLRELVNYCWEHVPFYRTRWGKHGVHPSEIQTIDDIYKLPVVTKEELQQDLNDVPPFGTFQGDRQACRLQASSGTTGMPKPFFLTRRDWDVITNLWARRLAAQGVTSEDRVQVSLTYSLFIPGFTSTEGIMKLGATVIPMGSGAATSTERQVILAKDWGATVLLMTPSYALHFADVAERMGYNLKKDFKVKRLIHTGEPLPKALREKIEDRWSVPAFDNFGSVESGGAPAFECEARQGMHINEDAFHFEVIDPDTGQSLPDGEEGLLVMTTLFKQASPIIRYSIGDFTSIDRTPCSCGRTFSRMSTVRARLDDMIKVRGTAVYPTSVEPVVRKYQELASEYRLVIDTVDNRDIIKLQAEVLELNKVDTQDLMDKIVRDLKVAVGIKCQVELLPFGSLSKEAEGRIKFKRFVDLRQK